MNDLKLAFRALRRPGFPLVVITVMGLSVGLATAAFSLAYTVFLRPLPFHSADRLALYCCTFPAQGSGWRDAPGSPAAMRDYQQAARSAEDVAIFYDQHNLNLTDDRAGEGAERLPVTFVAGNYFPLLGAVPALGRGFTEDECRDGAGQPVVVASHAFWVNHLGARRGAIGSTVRLNGRPYTVIGVMPEDFRDLSNENGPPQLWLPLPLVAPYLGTDFRANYAVQTFRAVVRLRSGVSFTAAQQEADAVAQRIALAQPATHHGRGIRLMPVREFFFLNVRRPVGVLFGGAVLVVLMGAVNLANLFMVDGLRRGRELAVRVALGADGRRLVRTVLAQATLLLSIGAAAGLMLAAGLIVACNHSATLALPDFARVQFSPVVLLAALVLVGLVALAAALVPAIRASRFDLSPALQSGSKGAGDSGGARTRNLLIAAEVAIATALLVATGLTAKSLLQVMHAENGYDARQLLSFQLQLDRTHLPTREQRILFARQLQDSLQGAPGIESATLWGPSMLGQAGWSYTVTPNGRDPADFRASLEVQHLHTVPGGLAALGLTLLRGRDFSRGEQPEYPAETIIDQEVARRLWPGLDPIGKDMYLFHDPARRLVVIGLVAAARNRGRTFDERTGTGDVYVSFYQVANDHVSVLIRHRTGQEAEALASARARIARLDPTLAIYNVREMEDRLAQQEHTPQFTAGLFGVYATISLLLAVVGIYGVLAFSVAQRTREFGIRFAIGATRRQVVQMVMGQGAAWIAAGVALGLAFATVATPLLGEVLIGVSPQDEGVFASAAGLIVVAGLAATFGPAWRAARVDPMIALKAE